MNVSSRSFLTASAQNWTEYAWLAANIAAIAIFVPLPALLLFFGTSFAALWLRESVPVRFRPAYVALSIAGLTALLLLYRNELGTVSATIRILLTQYLPGAVTLESLLAAVGVSYCWLRATLAMLDPAISPWRYVRYYFFFPTFLSGPIMVPRDFLSQSHEMTAAGVIDGMARILRGGMKFVASSFIQLGVPLAVTHHVAIALNTYPWWTLWPSTFLAGVWLYLNFSAFSDIYIGLGRVIGYRVPENFNNPFLACDITDFWRRWHISLGNWLRITVFNPLTRSVTNVVGAQSVWVAVVPAMITMVICGLWHGMTMAFLAWGAFHGGALGLHQAWRRFVRPLLGPERVRSGWYRFACWFVTHVYITFTWTLFFPINYPAADIHLRYISRLFGIAG